MITKKQERALERLTMGEKLPRKLKKQLKREAEGYVPKKKPRRLSPERKAKLKARKKAKQLDARMRAEANMMKHLVQRGWKRSGPAMDVWSIPSWKDGYPPVCYRTLRQAYRIQLKLDSEGYVRPAGVDDDLAAEL